MLHDYQDLQLRLQSAIIGFLRKEELTVHRNIIAAIQSKQKLEIPLSAVKDPSIKQHKFNFQVNVINEQHGMLTAPQSQIGTRDRSAYQNQGAFDSSYTFDWKGAEIIDMLFKSRIKQAFVMIRQKGKQPTLQVSKNESVSEISKIFRKIHILETKSNPTRNWIDNCYHNNGLEKTSRKNAKKISLINKLIPVIQPELLESSTNAN